jgi:hypothetical protein
VWVDSCTVDLGRVRAGIRANTRAGADAVAEAVTAHVVEDPQARKNFSLMLSQSPTRAHLLYWGGCVAARAFDPKRIVRALVDHLAAHQPPRDGLVWITSRAYVVDGRAVLLPTPLDDDLRVIDRELRLAGMVALDSPRALVDVRTGELVVEDLLGVDWPAFDDLVASTICRRAEPTVPFGRYPIDRWVFVDYSGRWGPITRATATRAAILEIVDGVERPTLVLFEQIGAIFDRVVATSMFPDRPKAAKLAAIGWLPDE